MAETAASFCLMLPLIITLIYVIAEASRGFLIVSSLSQCARQAARDLAIAYGQDSSIATSRALQDSMVFDKIRINNILNDSEQFDNPAFDANADPPTVTVTVRYLSGEHGLPVFPNPDPLGLGNSYQPSATSTYRLE